MDAELYLNIRHSPLHYLPSSRAKPLTRLLSPILLTASTLTMNGKQQVQFIKFQLSTTIFHSVFKLMRLFSGKNLSITGIGWLKPVIPTLDRELRESWVQGLPRLQNELKDNLGYTLMVCRHRIKGNKNIWQCS